MNPEMQTTLLNTYPPKLIATILKALREQLKENDQLNAVEEIAGPVLEIPLEYDQILKGGGRFWDDVNGGYLPEDLVWAAWIQLTRKFDRDCAMEYKTKKQGQIQRALPAFQLLSAMPPLEAVKALVSIMMSVSWSNKGKLLKMRHYDISRAHFHSTAQSVIHIRLPAEDRQKYGEDKVGRLIKSMYGTQDASHIWQLDYVTLIFAELGGFRGGKHSAVSF